MHEASKTWITATDPYEAFPSLSTKHTGQRAPPCRLTSLLGIALAVAASWSE